MIQELCDKIKEECEKRGRSLSEVGEMVMSGVKAYVDDKNTNKVFISNPYTRRN